MLFGIDPVDAVIACAAGAYIGTTVAELLITTRRMGEVEALATEWDTLSMHRSFSFAYCPTEARRGAMNYARFHTRSLRGYHTQLNRYRRSGAWLLPWGSMPRPDYITKLALAEPIPAPPSWDEPPCVPDDPYLHIMSER